MKLSKSFQGVLIGSACLLATNAFAANKGTLHVSSPEIVAGERLAARGNTPSVGTEQDPASSSELCKEQKWWSPRQPGLWPWITPPLAIAWLYKRMIRESGEYP